ncbi:MAG: T9SS type A sorting domain-containing protein [Bacteroidales bacterium]|nr:T9SS type A sorting domain-containing protein [Bacteroidales bacterium]MDY0284566.1 T9SS type A sorting domain-containing protein [Bacteroidales bacterium]HPE85808.1 T9SS type A sorting domain-containing protein [Bacteroidales bacterium]
MKKQLILITLVFAGSLLAAQEVIVPASGNPQLFPENNKKQPDRKQPQPLEIPFFDDFYTDTPYPAQARWDGMDGFQNQDFAVHPITQGVVTLDALDENGQIHEHALPGPSTWVSDYLTSQRIRLDSLFTPLPRALDASDSICLSFWFQPGGGLGPHPFNDIGTPPEAQDSLVLEFLAPAFADTNWIVKDTLINGKMETVRVIDSIEEAWDYIWSIRGMPLDSLLTETDNGYYFQQVIIPITNESRYFHKEFRFRFKNYVSLTSGILPAWQSNADMWNIDYVYLDKDRTLTEKNVKDLAFVNKGTSMLNDYYAMPFSQYRENYIFEMIDSLSNLLTNLDSENYNMTYKYRVKNSSGGLVYEYNGGSFAIRPFRENGYLTHQPFARPPVEFIYPIASADSAEFTITHFISSDENLPFKGNDTLHFHQRFYNYFAYDNGTAENGYGIEGDPNGMVAVKFKLNKTDTLRGIAIYFNQILDNPDDQTFHLTVWNHGDRMPGSTVYQQQAFRPDPTDYPNTFHTFILDEPIVIDPITFPNLIFYVGWQKNDNEMLNVGFDRSRNSIANNFYLVNGIWYNSLQNGTVMIRPLLGKPLPYNTGIQTRNPINNLTLYPNPAKNDNTLHISLSDASPFSAEQGTLTLYNNQGIRIVESRFTPTLSIAGLPAGLYILQYNDHKGKITTEKFIISR